MEKEDISRIMGYLEFDNSKDVFNNLMKASDYDLKKMVVHLYEICCLFDDISPDDGDMSLDALMRHCYVAAKSELMIDVSKEISAAISLVGVQ